MEIMEQKEIIMFQKVLAKTVAKMRERSGKNSEEFANQIGIPHATLSDMENGDTVIPVEKLIKIGNVLGCEGSGVVGAAEIFAKQLEETGNFSIDLETTQTRREPIEQADTAPTDATQADTAQVEKPDNTGVLVGGLIVGAIIGYLISKK